MSVENHLELASNQGSHSIPDTITFLDKNSYLQIAMQTHQGAYPIIQSLKRFFRDRFYLPLRQEANDPFFIDSGRYAEQFVAMLKGENPDLDATFPQLTDIIQHFIIRDVAVEVPIGEKTVVFQTRVIESRGDNKKEKLRLILFSFANHQVKTDKKLSPWDPLHIDELSASIWDILKAYQTYIQIDSMICFSLGTICYDGLKHVLPEDFHCIPKILGFNRGLSSIKKVSQKLYPFPLNACLHNAVYYLGLDANPEKELLRFFQNLQSNRDPSIDQRQVIVIEARDDYYFSGKGKLDQDFPEKLQNAGANVFHGTFFVPMIAQRSHHAIRLDWIINNEKAGTETTHFLPFPTNQTLAQGIAENIFRQTEDNKAHTCLLVGGNRDNLNTITYLQAAPLLIAYLQKKELA